MIESIVKYVLSELRVITQAPLAFTLSLAVLAIMIWRAVAWRYAGTIDSLEGRNKLQADQIADYKGKLSGASPDEAKRRLDALELMVKALSPRRLDDTQKAKIVAALGNSKGVIDIVQDLAAADAKVLAGDLGLTFQSSGWGVSLSMVMGLTNSPRSGIGLQVLNPSALRPIEMTVARALEAAGVSFDVQTGLRRSPPRPSVPEGFPTIPQEPDPDVGLLISTRLN